MSIYITSDMAKINIQQTLNNSVNSYQKTMEKLASGYKYTRTSDDPIGISQATKMTVKMAATNEAISNVNIGGSLLSIASSGQEQVLTNLQRIRDLCLQAENGTYSASDLLASIIAFFSVSESSKPADKDHPYGHGKYEDLGSFIEGILIIFAAFYIIYESLKKIIFVHNVQIDTHLGITVMFISIVANMFVSSYLFKVAKKTDSRALYADGEHLRTDIYSSLAVLIGLVCVKLTGNPIFDPVIAIVVAIIIFSAGLKICEKAKESLLDVALSEASISQIRKIIAEEDRIIELKSLKTRNGGLIKNIELTLVVEQSMPISLAHELCDEIEKNIETALKNTDISIHLEPNN